MSDLETFAQNEVALKEGSTKPKVSLSFELSRSHILKVTKAEMKIEELVVTEKKSEKSLKSKKDKTDDDS